MEDAAVVKNRRGVRAYLHDPVPAETLDHIIDTARRSPSAGFSQGIDFLVIDNPEENDTFWTLTHHPEHGSQIDEARPPVLVLVFSDPLRYLARYSEDDKLEFGLDDLDRWPVRFWDVDAAMAAMQLQLTAVDEGLGTWFFGIAYGEDAVLSHFKVPDDRRLVGVIALGYRDESVKLIGSGATRRRRDLGEQLHRNAW